MISVKDHKVAVDVLLELEDYLDQFDGYKIRDDKLQSCSPFRQDNHPSFAVNLENGSWIDSGSVGEFHKGHFITLLAFLRSEDTDDTAEYLLDSYQIDRQDVETLQLDMNSLTVKQEVPFLTVDQLQQFAYRHPYLTDRGISEKVQKFFRVGYSNQFKAVVMPHTDRTGNLTNFKFRSVNSKKFWYFGGQPVKNHLYGLHQCLKVGAESVYIVESETDCMRLWTEEKPAIALGTAHISKRQIKLLQSSGFKELIIATDNDTAGQECAEKLVKLFSGDFTVNKLVFPEGVKDICDMTGNQINSAEIVSAFKQLNLGGLTFGY